MLIEVCPTSAAAGARAAELIAEHLRTAVAERGNATVALSGGSTPQPMLRELASTRLPWPQIHVFQVDERFVGEDDDQSNMRMIRSAFKKSDIPLEHLHRMPVGHASPAVGAAQYASDLSAVAGSPPVIDVVQLGLGDDGHTASLVPNDHAVEADSEVTVTEPYKGVRRMTLTLNALNRARSRVWLVCGPAKRNIVGRLLDRDPNVIASRILSEGSILVLDQDASGSDR